MKKIEHVSSYQIGDGEVRLQVAIGEGQFGSTRAVVGTKQVDDVHDMDTVLGKGSDLRGRELVITSVVTDTNPQTNRTSVTYRLSGGSTPLKQELSFTVESDADSVLYKATFRLE
jgi:hypothetical protein